MLIAKQMEREPKGTATPDEDPKSYITSIAQAAIESCWNGSMSNSNLPRTCHPLLYCD